MLTVVIKQGQGVAELLPPGWQCLSCWLCGSYAWGSAGWGQQAECEQGDGSFGLEMPHCGGGSDTKAQRWLLSGAPGSLLSSSRHAPGRAAGATVAEDRGAKGSSEIMRVKSKV